MTIHRILLSLFLLSAARPARAVEGARWLLAPEGVRSAALANAVTVLDADSEAVWANPAGLAGLDGVEASFAHLNYADAWDSDHVVLGAPLHWRHHFGLLYHRNGAQDTLRDAYGNETGNFEVSQSALGAAYAYKGSNWSLGATLKSLNETIQATSASALAYDLGGQLRLADQRLRLGLAAQNLGSAPDLGGPAVEAPTQLRAGAAMRFADEVSRFEILADYRWRPANGRSGVSVAAEYSERYMEGRLGLRAGYDFSQGELGDGAGLALGAGFGYGPVGLDYAWSPRGNLGSQHRIALKLLWDLRARARREELARVVGDVAAVPDVKPVATPEVKVKSRGESQAGNRLDEILDQEAEPTPAVTPLPAVAESAPKPKGILGFFARLFGAAPKEEKSDEAKAVDDKPGLLGSFFHFLGFGGGEAAPVADTPEKAREDSFGDTAPVATPTALPMQRLKGDDIALPKATPTPVPVKEKVKSWMKF